MAGRILPALAVHRQGVRAFHLLPMGFTVLLVNLPETGLLKVQPVGGLLNLFYHYGLEWEVLPPLIFLGLEALTDLGPVIANAKTILLGTHDV